MGGIVYIDKDQTLLAGGHIDPALGGGEIMDHGGQGQPPASLGLVRIMNIEDGQALAFGEIGPVPGDTVYRSKPFFALNNVLSSRPKRAWDYYTPFRAGRDFP